MGDADSALGRPPAGGRPALDVLALAPLPYLDAGRTAFEGGVTVFYAELLPRLAALGHRVRVLAEAPAAAGPEARRGLPWRVSGLEVTWFGFPYHSSSQPPDGAARLRLGRALDTAFARMLATRRPDVVLIGREIVALAALPRAQAAGIPAVVVAHGLATAALRHDVYPPPLRRELVACLRAAGAVVAVAEHLAADLRTLGVTRVAAVPNVADPARFHPGPKDATLRAALDLAPDHVVVAHPSVLRARKRPLDIVASAPAVVTGAPAVVYLVLGDGPCRAEMEAAVRRAGLDACFRFTGQIEHARMPEHLRLADVVVLPSETEGFPLAYCEAQASGVVLLASDIAPAREVIRDGETGLLFRTGDVADLAAQTLRLARDPALRRRLGRAARAVAERRTPAAWAAAYADVLASAAARPV